MARQVKLLNAKEINRAITRIAHEIIEKNKGSEDIILVGIKSRGVPLANRLAEKIKAIEGREIPVGILDITLYRDDLVKERRSEPIIHDSNIKSNINEKTVILVDDVLYTGRTTRAALDALIDIGRPRIIQLAVLIDRAIESYQLGRIMGKMFQLQKSEIVRVYLEEVDGNNGAILKKMIDAEIWL